MGDVNVQVNGLCLAQTDEPILQIAEFKVDQLMPLCSWDQPNHRSVIAVDLQGEECRHSGVQDDSVLPVGYEICVPASWYKQGLYRLNLLW